MRPAHLPPLLLLLGFLVSAAPTMGAAAAGTSPATLVGTVHEEDADQPLGFVDLILVELNHAVSSHADGHFHFLRVPPGEYTLRVTRIGYRELFRKVNLFPGDTLRLDLTLHHSAVELQDVEVKGLREQEESVRHEPVTDMAGGKLQRNLGTTIAETVGDEPGIAQRTMGPAPARPVLRGLSGDRLLILEDGQRTGDLSGSSSDHAVAIEPMTANRIEVMRGPETLLYGPGVLGGVVDVKREGIVRNEPHRTHGSALIEVGSVNRGAGSGVELVVPLTSLTGIPFAFRTDGSFRSADDMTTPSGTLGNTSLHTSNGSVSLSYLPSWGMIGVGGAAYDSEYGIPGGFVGAHPNGVDIDMSRRRLDVATVAYVDWLRIKRVELDYSFSRYQHAEYESSGSLGMEFGVLTDHADLKLHLGKHAFFQSGVFGLSGEWRNYATGGLSFTPDTRETSLGAYLYQQREFDTFHLDMALRMDRRLILPDEQRTSIFVGDIRDRSFAGFSGAIRAETHFTRTLSGGVSLLKSFRSPTVEELFSEGPHLAAYSYEVGDADLGSEHGYGGEVYVRRTAGFIRGRAALFINQFDGYIFPRNTGAFSPRRADLYEYRYTGLDARMTGAEGRVEFDASTHLTLTLSASYVRGLLLDGGDNLPMIPPLNGSFGIDWHCCIWSVGADLLGAFEQDQLGDFEQPTAGYARLDLHAQYQKTWAGLLHSVVVKVENATDAEYRQHLSRVKSVMPEPGRNAKLVYRVYF
ncbi:TonB-dependent receptor [bacterium]|nr:TonB-dependent receptor [bacterium]